MLNTQSNSRPLDRKSNILIIRVQYWCNTDAELTNHAGRTSLQMQQHGSLWSHCRRGWDAAIDSDSQRLAWIQNGCDYEPAGDCQVTSSYQTRCSHLPASMISRYCSALYVTPHVMIQQCLTHKKKKLTGTIASFVCCIWPKQIKSDI